MSEAAHVLKPAHRRRHACRPVDKSKQQQFIPLQGDRVSLRISIVQPAKPESRSILTSSANGMEGPLPSPQASRDLCILKWYHASLVPVPLLGPHGGLVQAPSWGACTSGWEGRMQMSSQLQQDVLLRVWLSPVTV